MATTRLPPRSLHEHIRNLLHGPSPLSTAERAQLAYNLSFLLKCHSYRFRDTSYAETRHNDVDLVVMSFGTRVCMALLLSTGRGKWEVILKGKETVLRDQMMLNLRDEAEYRVGSVLERAKTGKKLKVWDLFLRKKTRRDDIEEHSGSSSRSSSIARETS